MHRHGHHHIVFNGEIYNFLELRRELEAAGEVFASDSDDEVLLAAFIRWGAASAGSTACGPWPSGIATTAGCS
jgi:asparagine synthetase B (glutamine-hydrolysing)